MNELGERRLQVFISSTYIDLIEERQATHRAVLQLNHIPAGMELFNAGNDDAWTLISRVIERSDVYLLIIGGRYGSTDEHGIGFTEREYDFAVSLKKPVIALLHEQPSSLPRNRTEQEDLAWQKLHSFAEKVRKRHTCAFWNNASELRAAAMAALIQASATVPGGWVRVAAELPQRRVMEAPKDRSTPRLTDLKDAILNAVVALDEAYQRDEFRSGASTGLIDLDRMLGGVRPGEVVTIAGRPGMGSSMLALQMILEIAKLELPVLIVSVSHSATYYSQRLLAALGSLDAHQVFSGAVTDEDWPRLIHAIQTLDKLTVVIDDSPEANTVHIAKACEEAKERFGTLPALLIDDAHLITCTDLPGEETFGRFVKRLARRFDATVILTSGLLRSVEERVSKRPVLRDLVVPTGLAEMSDAVLFVYDDAHYNFESLNRGTVEVIIARNNSGPIGTVRLTKLHGVVGNFAGVESASLADNDPFGVDRDNPF